MVKRLFYFFSLISILLFGVLFCSCIEQIRIQDGPPDDGIESMSLIIGRDNLTELLKATFIERWFPVFVKDDTGDCNARIRIHGGLSCHFPKKTFKVKAYGGYPQKVAKALQLSAQYNDTSFCRYRLAHKLFKKAGLLCPEVRPIHLFFDNCYHGIYLAIEIVDELFLQKRNLPISSLYKAKSNSWFTSKNNVVPQAHFDKKLPEDDMTYSDLEQLFLILDKGLTVNDTASLSAVLDIKNVLDYYTVSMLIRHYDGIVKNFYLYLNPTIKKFQFIPWDFDLTFYNSPHLEYDTWKNNLYEQLMAIEAYKLYIKNRMKELFDYNEMTNTLDSLRIEIESAVEHDPWLKVEPRDFWGEVAELQRFLSRLNVILRIED